MCGGGGGEQVDCENIERILNGAEYVSGGKLNISSSDLTFSHRRSNKESCVMGQGRVFRWKYMLKRPLNPKTSSSGFLHFFTFFLVFLLFLLFSNF